LQGATKVAIYGLGFMREERLARVFQMPGQVAWLRPEKDGDAWFNIFVLHQNRVQHYKQGPLNKARSLRPEFLPKWLDVVRASSLLYPLYSAINRDIERLLMHCRRKQCHTQKAANGGCLAADCQTTFC
jgi:hypothetical protein